MKRPLLVAYGILLIVIPLVSVNCSPLLRHRDTQVDDPKSKLDKAINEYYCALQKKQFGKVYGMVSDEYWASSYKKGTGANPDERTQKREFLGGMRDTTIYGRKGFEISEWKVLKQRIRGNKAYVIVNLVWISSVSKQTIRAFPLYDVWIYSDSRWALVSFIEPSPPDDDWPSD